MSIIETAAWWRKGISAVLAFVGVLLSSGLLEGETQAWVSAIVAGVGAALVILLPNGYDEGADSQADG